VPLWLRTDGNERGVRVEAKGKKKREDIQPVPWGLKERQKIFDRLKNKQIRLKKQDKLRLWC